MKKVVISFCCVLVCVCVFVVEREMERQLGG